MNHTHRWISAVLISFFLISVPLAADTTNETLNRQLTPALDKLLSERGVPGLAVAVVHDGDVAYRHAFGVKDAETKDPVTTRSLFHWASVTKLFVGTALTQLAEQGLVDFDAPVIEYVPYFELSDDRYREITVRQMLTHTSGMPDVINYEWHNPVYDDGALERYVRSLSDEELIAAPGQEMRYSNMAFDVLGDVVAKVSGTTFEEYVRKNLLDPLKMNDSTLLKKEADEDLLTTPHTRTRTRGTIARKYWPYNRKHAPSSTMISNVEDMSRWALVHLNRGELDGARILESESYDVMWSPQSPIAENIGISWFLDEYKGYRTVGHQGGDRGFGSNFILIPEKKLGVMLVTNTDEAPIQEITALILDAALRLAE